MFFSFLKVKVLYRSFFKNYLDIKQSFIIPDLFVNTRTSLQFDFSSLSTEQTAVEEDVWNTLKQLTKGSSQGVGKEVPQLFDQLISQLSNLDDQQLVKVNWYKLSLRMFY